MTFEPSFTYVAGSKVITRNKRMYRGEHGDEATSVQYETIFHFSTQCVSPYVGDGSLCVLDSDGDSYPDKMLRTCSDTDTFTYCNTDTCTYAPNNDQNDITPCRGAITGISATSTVHMCTASLYSHTYFFVSSCKH